MDISLQGAEHVEAAEAVDVEGPLIWRGKQSLAQKRKKEKDLAESARSKAKAAKDKEAARQKKEEQQRHREAAAAAKAAARAARQQQEQEAAALTAASSPASSTDSLPRTKSDVPKSSQAQQQPALQKHRSSEERKSKARQTSPSSSSSKDTLKEPKKPESATTATVKRQLVSSEAMVKAGQLPTTGNNGKTIKPVTSNGTNGKAFPTKTPSPPAQAKPAPKPAKPIGVRTDRSPSSSSLPSPSTASSPEISTSSAYSHPQLSPNPAVRPWASPQSKPIQQPPPWQMHQPHQTQPQQPHAARQVPPGLSPQVAASNGPTRFPTAYGATTPTSTLRSPSNTHTAYPYGQSPASPSPTGFPAGFPTTPTSGTIQPPPQMSLSVPAGLPQPPQMVPASPQTPSRPHGTPLGGLTGPGASPGMYPGPGHPSMMSPDHRRSNPGGFIGQQGAADDLNLDLLTVLSQQGLPSAPNTPQNLRTPVSSAAYGLQPARPDGGRAGPGSGGLLSSDLAAIWNDGPQPPATPQLTGPSGLNPAVGGGPLLGGICPAGGTYQPFGSSSIWGAGSTGTALGGAGQPRTTSDDLTSFLPQGLGSLGWSVQTDGQHDFRQGPPGQK
eukprot:scaffold166461_cov43-Prasinocladus_malaysianus.AAC.5